MCGGLLVREVQKHYTRLHTDHGAIVATSHEANSSCCSLSTSLADADQSLWNTAELLVDSSESALLGNHGVMFTRSRDTISREECRGMPTAVMMMIMMMMMLMMVVMMLTTMS